ncbi:MAG: M23 family metallopeptidase [Acidobacteria bacterium]|nr:M23 family metallopeptidase [Acidobacteriota bacterium]
MMRKLVALLIVSIVLVGGAYAAAGFVDGPSIVISRPERFVGAATPVDVEIGTPGGVLSSLEVTFEQGGATTPIVSLADASAVTAAADRVIVKTEIGRGKVSSLQSGPARLLVTASRPVLFGLRRVRASVAKDVQVRLERPRIGVLSTHHYVNLGGAEMVVYRAEPADVSSGVRVGEREYPGFPASGATVDGVSIADPAVRIAFFALLWNQPIDAPIRVFARDEAGNAAEAAFDTRAFPKPFKASRIVLDDRFLERVVPAILSGASEMKPAGPLLEQFLAVNGELRRANAEKIRSFASKTSPEMLWRGVVFHPFTNSAVESAFADQRTYLYQGREVDRQVHLGFDLASYAGTPIVAANRGQVLFAGDLGIYGNCVVLDHGMGVQSLYAHLSAVEVQPGVMVEKEQRLGRSGMTGLAGGDHLHFTMLVNGEMVNPIEWWDPHWIEDRVLRKLRMAK